MATSKGGAIAAPQIFGSDPIEQAFAQKVVAGDPGMSGIAGALMLAAGMGRERHQGTYLDALSQSNKMAAALAQQETQQKAMEAALQHGPKWTEQGFLPGDIPMVGQLFSDPKGEGATVPPHLQRDFMRAKIAEKLADAQKARSGGGGKEPQYEVSTIQNADGSTSIVDIKVKGNLSSRADIDRAVQGGNVTARDARGNPSIPPGAPPLWQRGQGEVTSAAQQQWERNHPGQKFPGGQGSRNQ